MREFVVLTLFLTFLQFELNRSFSIQKRQAQKPSDLRNALEVLQRKRRRVGDSNLQSLYRDIDDQYLPYADGYLPYGYAEEADDNGDLEDQYALANMLTSYQDQYSDNQRTDVNQAEPSKSENPTLDEIKKIFDEIDNSENKKKSNSQSKTENDKISQQQMDELLSEAVKVPSGDDKVNEDGTSNHDSPEPVSADELKDVFKETNVENNLSNDNKEKLESIGQEIISHNDQLSKKKKRMTKRDNSDQDQNNEETLLNLVQEVQELRGKVAQLQLVEYLEDKENDYLASALKAATLAQLRNGEPYLENEYSEIQKALQIEEALQGLKTVDQNEDETEETNVKVEQLFPERKRSQPPYEDNLGIWYDEPVQDEENAQQKLEDFVKQYRATYDVDNEEDTNDDETIPVNVPLSALPENEDVCQQLSLLSSNCEVASLLDIDDEARDLCNRHEVCYICGPTVGLSQHDCDTGFRSETVERCRDGKCIQSGAEFLWFIKQDHKYTNSYLEQCAAPCVKRYIVEG